MVRCCPLGLGLLPITLILLSFVTFITTYIIAVIKDDVSPIFPYISDTGTDPPESCVFSQFLNLAAALSLCTIYIRYKQIDTLTGAEVRRIQCLNRMSLVLGIISSLGLSVVANFQETEVESVHIIGAASVFGVGIVYEFIQIIISYHMQPVYHSSRICHIRLSIWIFSLATMIVTFTAGIFSRVIWDTSMHRTGTSRLHWQPDDPGYAAHVTSTIGEWVMSFSFLAFFLTYIRDFQKIRLEIHTRLHVDNLDYDQLYGSASVHSDDERTRLIV